MPGRPAREAPVRNDSARYVHGQLISRIEALQADCARLTCAALCDRLDDLRIFSRRHGYDAVEGLASMLESVVAYNGHRQVAMTYFALMRDAVAGSEAPPPESARVYLAAAALRGCR